MIHVSLFNSWHFTTNTSWLSTHYYSLLDLSLFFKFSGCHGYVIEFSLSFLPQPKFFKRTEENQLDATECFIALTVCSTCFRQLYAHHQELETILVLLSYMVCNALVAGGRLLGAEQQAMHPGWGEFVRLASRTIPLIPDA